MARKLPAAFLLCLCGLAWWLSHPWKAEGTPPGTVPPPAKTRREPPRPRGAAGVADALRSARTEERRLALDILLPDLLRRDPRAAAAMAAELPDWAAREPALLQVADAWAATDPAAAAAWAGALDTLEERRLCLAAACRRIARSDPAQALSQASLFPEGEDPALLEDLAATYLASSRPGAREEAAAWIRATRSPEESDRCWAAGVRMMAEKSPGDAAALAVEHISPGPAQDEAVISILHQWSRQDRAAAAAWVALFPESPLRTRAEREIKTMH